MPKPTLLHRPSGLYVRFFVPSDLHGKWGSRYIVRSLQGQRDDQARLTIARLGYALCSAFECSRREPMKDPKSLLEAALHAARIGRDYTLELPNGFKLTADSPEDHARAMEAMDRVGRLMAPPTPSEALPKPVGLLSERINTFLKQMRTKERSETNLLDTTFTLGLFVALIGDKDLSQVNTDDTDAFVDALAYWPANASKKSEYRNLDPRAILAKAKTCADGRLAPRTKEKHLDRLRAFFNYCVQRRLISFNPVQGLNITSKAQDEAPSRLPFDEQDLRLIFDPASRTKGGINQPHKIWVPMMGLYTGARLNELAQLYVDDIESIEGIWGLHINNRFEGQRMKNRQSVRFLPLHPKLIDVGLLDYAADVRAAGFKHLFPGLTWGTNGPGDTVGDWFNRSYLRRICEITDPRKTFHCFRHTFATVATRSGLPEPRIAALTGHTRGGSVLRQHYIHPETLAERATDLRKIAFPELPLPRHCKGFYQPWFNRVRSLAARPKP